MAINSDKNSLFNTGTIGEMGLCVREQREHRKIIENHLPNSSNSFSLVIFSGPLARIVTTGDEKPAFLARAITLTSSVPLCFLRTLKKPDHLLCDGLSLRQPGCLEDFSIISLRRFYERPS